MLPSQASHRASRPIPVGRACAPMGFAPPPQLVVSVRSDGEDKREDTWQIHDMLELFLTQGISSSCW